MKKYNLNQTGRGEGGGGVTKRMEGLEREKKGVIVVLIIHLKLSIEKKRPLKVNCNELNYVSYFPRKEEKVF